MYRNRKSDFLYWVATASFLIPIYCHEKYQSRCDVTIICLCTSLVMSRDAGDNNTNVVSKDIANSVMRARCFPECTDGVLESRVSREIFPDLKGSQTWYGSQQPSVISPSGFRFFISGLLFSGFPRVAVLVLAASVSEKPDPACCRAQKPWRSSYAWPQ